MDVGIITIGGGSLVVAVVVAVVVVVVVAVVGVLSWVLSSLIEASARLVIEYCATPVFSTR